MIPPAMMFSTNCICSRSLAVQRQRGQPWPWGARALQESSGKLQDKKKEESGWRRRIRRVPSAGGFLCVCVCVLLGNYSTGLIPGSSWGANEWDQTCEAFTELQSSGCAHEPDSIHVNMCAGDWKWDGIRFLCSWNWSAPHKQLGPYRAS